ncbi:MAG: MFS transporter [Pseudomonadota bacterium]
MPISAAESCSDSRIGATSTAIPIGTVLDRFGLRPCLFAAAVLLSASAGFRALADSYTGLLLAVMLMGVGGPLISVGAPKLVSRWFRGTERGFAMGIYTSSVGVGTLLALTLTASVILPAVGGSWQAAFGVYALATLVSVIVWLAIASHPLSRLGNRGAAEAAAPIRFGVFREMLGSGEIRLILGLAIALFYFTHALNAWLPEILRAKGLSLVAAGYWASVPTAVAIVATLIIPGLATPPRRIAFVIAIALTGLISVLSVDVTSTPLLAASLTGQGIARSCLMPIAMLLLMESKSLSGKALGSATGLFFTAAEIGGVMGPLVSGWLIDVSASYDAPLYSMAAVMAIVVALALRLRRYGV